MNRRLFLGAALIVALGGQALVPHAQAAPAAPDAPPFALVKDINTTPQPNGSFYSQPLFAVIGNTILFSAITPQTGNELWRTDGTESGTQLVKDINPGWDGALPYYGGATFVLSNTLLFPADDGATGMELWRSDGTAAGTMLVKDTWPGADTGYPTSFVASADGRVFFTAQISETHYALWITDGTPAGTTLLHSFNTINTSTCSWAAR